MGFVKVLLWYSGVATGAQSGRAAGSPWTARVERPGRRFTLGSRDGQRERASREAAGEALGDELLEQLGCGGRRADGVQGAVGLLVHDRQAVPREHGLDRFAVRLRDPPAQQYRDPFTPQLRD